MDKNLYIFRMEYPNASKLGSLLEQAWIYKMWYIYIYRERERDKNFIFLQKWYFVFNPVNMHCWHKLSKLGFPSSQN